MSPIEPQPTFGQKPVTPPPTASPTGKAAPFSLRLKAPTGDVGQALAQALSQGQETISWGQKFYRFLKEPAGKGAFWVNVEEYTGKPGKGVKPTASYNQAYFIQTRKGIYEHFRVFIGKDKTPAPSLNTQSQTPVLMPTNLKQLALEDPTLYHQFYQMLLQHLALAIMSNLRQQQKRMKASMQSSE